MAQQTITNGQGGLSVRNALNSMFTELYGGIPLPTKLNGISANTTQAILANAYISSISIAAVSGAPTIRIGTTPNGQDILKDSVPGAFLLLALQQYFSGATTLYITITGGGSVNIRLEIKNNYF